MRIHRLEVQAFGPFAERVVLDVDALTAGGLFLIHGPTGSGKTSLLDAVCFALYADVPGARGRGSLRSDHAPPEVPPQVLLEVTVGGRRLRLTRSPAWHRPRKRGEGLTPVQAGVVLEELGADGWSTLSTRHDEVADVVKDVLGMGLSQFAKVVLLPQGEFAAFLRATPEDRREVLERLFDIGVYGDVEQWLTEHRRVLAADLDRARSGLTADLARVEDVLTDSGVEPEPPALRLDPDAVDVLPARLQDVQRELDAAMSQAMAVADAATGAEQVAQAALAEGRARAADRGRGLEARGRVEVLLAEADTHAARRHELETAERAATVAGHVLAYDRAAADHAATLERLSEHRAAVAALGAEVPDDPVGAAAEVHELDEVAFSLTRHTDRARELAGTLTDTEERLAATRRAREETGVALAEADARLATRSEEVEALAESAAQVSERALVVDAARGRVGLLDEADADAARRHELAPRLVTARDHVLSAQSDLVRLQQRRLDGMAVQLAGDLVDGGACPVCGALEHPRPATGTDPVSDDDLAVAESALAAARATLVRVEAEDTALGAAVETRLSALGGLDRAALDRAVEEAVAAHADAVAAAHRHAEARQALADLEADVGHRRAEGSRLEAQAEALLERLTELTAEAESVHRLLSRAVELHSGCRCGSGESGTHARLARALDGLARAEEDERGAQVRLGAATADLEAALVEVGFECVADAREARRPDPELEALREEVTRHVRDADTCRAVLEEPSVAAALADDPPDLAALETAAGEARREVLAASATLDAVTRAVRAIERLRPGIEAACAGLRELTDRHVRVRELADAVAGTGGDNTLRMRLTSFVLAARLEKVAALANERLRVMGAGRYLLEHTDDRAARGARSGLGLRVLDQWTGRARETSSLSGGESFMASLALALGLADAVREESGGLDLGTLFVDEGFGSLDEESLEQVLGVLDGLREGGRAVGVVSHVADLRTRIPYQAVVHKSTAGSTVEVRTPSARAPAA